MRKGMFGSVATVLMGTGAALAQNPYYLPTEGRLPAGPTNGVPALLSADPVQTPAAAATAPPTLSGGSTGLVPGIDCLPASVPEHARYYGDVSYMLTWVKDAPSPGPLAIAAPSAAGVFGPGAGIILGNQDTSFDGQSGIRAKVGAWLGCDGKVGVEAGGFVLEQQSQLNAISSDGSVGNPILARPFANLNAVPAAGSSIIIASPGVAGAIAQKETTNLWGAEFNGVLNWRDDCNRRIDLIAGFTYTDLHETLGVTSLSTPTGGTTTILDDAVGTRNQFYAGQVGARSTWTFGKLSLTMSGEIAAGVNHESVDRQGTTAFIAPGGAITTAPGAFLVQSSNAGRIATDKFAVGLPSQILLGYQVTDHVNAFLGYDFIYITNTLRPGDQTDLSFQTAANGTLAHPSAAIHQTDFWANSLLAGVSFKY